MNKKKITTLAVAAFGLLLSACNGATNTSSSSSSINNGGGGGGGGGGGNGGGRGFTQRVLTRTEAIAVSNDINKKQQESFGSITSTSYEALQLDAPKFEAPRVKKAPIKYSTAPSTSYDWDYGDDYWSNYDFEDDYYDTDWVYERDDDYDSWAYEESEDYEDWLEERNAAKELVVPDQATINLYLESASPYEGSITEEIAISYDLDKYYARIDVDVSVGTESNESNIVIYYDDGQLHFNTGGYDNNGYATDEQVLPVSATQLNTEFAEFKAEITEFFKQFSTGMGVNDYIEVFKETGFESKYYSDDAGNLVMDIEGEGQATMEEMNFAAEADIEAVWDGYLMRSADSHIKLTNGNQEMAMHMIYGYSDECEICYPGYNPNGGEATIDLGHGVFAERQPSYDVTTFKQITKQEAVSLINQKKKLAVKRLSYEALTEADYFDDLSDDIHTFVNWYEGNHCWYSKMLVSNDPSNPPGAECIATVNENLLRATDLNILYEGSTQYVRHSNYTTITAVNYQINTYSDNIKTLSIAISFTNPASGVIGTTSTTQFMDIYEYYIDSMFPRLIAFEVEEEPGIYAPYSAGEYILDNQFSLA